MNTLKITSRFMLISLFLIAQLAIASQPFCNPQSKYKIATIPHLKNATQKEKNEVELHTAVHYLDVDGAASLLASGVDINFRRNGIQPLFVVLQDLQVDNILKYMPMIKFLLVQPNLDTYAERDNEAGVNQESADRYTRTPVGIVFKFALDNDNTQRYHSNLAVFQLFIYLGHVYCLEEYRRDPKSLNQYISGRGDFYLLQLIKEPYDYYFPIKYKEEHASMVAAIGQNNAVILRSVFNKLGLITKTNNVFTNLSLIIGQYLGLGLKHHVITKDHEAAPVKAKAAPIAVSKQ